MERAAASDSAETEAAAKVARGGVAGPAAHRPTGILIRFRRRFVLLALIASCAAAALGFIIARASGGHESPGATPSVSYATKLDSVIGQLNVARSVASTELSRSRDAHAQAAAARSLATAHAQAASALQGVQAGTATLANSAVVAALQRTSSAYQALARAVTLGDLHGEQAAFASLKRANQDLSSALAQLRTLGYRVA